MHIIALSLRTRTKNSFICSKVTKENVSISIYFHWNFIIKGLETRQDKKMAFEKTFPGGLRYNNNNKTRSSGSRTHVLLVDTSIEL